MFTFLFLSLRFGSTDSTVTNTWGRQMHIIPGGGERLLPWSEKSLLMLGQIGGERRPDWVQRDVTRRPGQQSLHTWPGCMRDSSGLQPPEAWLYPLRGRDRRLHKEDVQSQLGPSVDGRTQSFRVRLCPEGCRGPSPGTALSQESF